MANASADQNEQNIVNSSLSRISSSSADAATNAIPSMSVSGSGVNRTPVYVSRTALNATTGQTEADTVLIIP